jgi:hypothetical protein
LYRSGKFGTVRLGKCRVTGISVAIKSIGMKALHADVTELAALFNEIAILKKVLACVSRMALRYPSIRFVSACGADKCVEAPKPCAVPPRI